MHPTRRVWFAVLLARVTGVFALWPAYCAHHCLCQVERSSMSQTERLTVVCDGDWLTHIPAGIPSDTQSLVLSSTNIQLTSLSSLQRFANLTDLDMSNSNIFDTSDFSVVLPSLRYLSLDYNDIDYLKYATFNNTPHLVYLSLAHNDIEVMHGGAFKGLHRLKTLDLSNNRLFSIETDWFTGLPWLQTLSIGSNNLKKLHAGSFQHLVRLRTLDLNNNEITQADTNAFVYLTQLRLLNMSHNHIRHIPTSALQTFATVYTVDLSENQVSRIEAGSFEYVNASVLMLNDMRDLYLVHKHAFAHMHYLRRMTICDNRNLKYVDREAFYDVPFMNTLFISGNGLRVLEEDIVRHLPGLQQLSLAGNPMVCDCNMQWVRPAELRDRWPNLTLLDANQTACCSNLPNSTHQDCVPSVLPLFATVLKRFTADSLQLDCRAVGIPRPSVNWTLPANARGQATVSADGTLYVDYVESRHDGQYTCIGVNEYGLDRRLTYVHVQSAKLALIVQRATSTSIAVTWRHVHSQHQYQIQYRHANDTYTTIDVQPYMRSYTINDLQPGTIYEFCIALRHNCTFVRMNCTQKSTREKSFDRIGVYTIERYVIIGLVAGSVISLCVVCVVVHALRTFNATKEREEELYSDNMSQLFLAGMDSMSESGPVTFENRAAEMSDDDDIEDVLDWETAPTSA